jgi:outer membrane protein, heavy metal efflux system
LEATKKSSKMRFPLLIWLFFLTSKLVFGQNKVTLDVAINAAFQNSPTQKAAIYDVQNKSFLEKTARNLPNPELNAESPTGDFYTLGISQSFIWPTAYLRQKKLAKAETDLAKIGQKINENDLRFLVRTTYLEAQMADLQAEKWGSRDSLYQKIGTAVARQFAAGEIDFLQKTMAENEVGKVKQARLIAEKSAIFTKKQLEILTGIGKIEFLSEIQTDTISIFQNVDFSENPSFLYQKQVENVAKQQVEVAKNNALPSFSLGYLNQSFRQSPLEYRFRAAIGIPLWFGQNRAAVRAAEAASQATLAKSAGQYQSKLLEIQRAKSETENAIENFLYLERSAMPRSQELIGAAIRLRDAGQIDYVTFLRTLDEAFLIQNTYFEVVETLNFTQIQTKYLFGI